MDKRKLGLEDFYAWYQENKIRLREDAFKYSIHNEKLREEFLKEWPLDRILTMSIDDYVIGKGAKSNSFCYALEIGKYQSLFMGIGGGGSSKFGIYWNENTKSYKNQANKIIPESELEDRFNKLKSDLYEIIQAGRVLDFNNPIFDMKQSKNEFIRRSAVVTKLLCIYSENPSFLGVNMNSQNEFWNRLIPQSNQGGPYRQNHEICKLFSKTYPELESSMLGSILFEYSKDFIDSDNKQGEKEMSEQNNIHHPLSNILLQSKNLILRGAPGTGKTHLAIDIANELTDGNEDQIGFVQFHPSYDYTDFVEGLRPILVNDGQINFGLQDGIFKKFCQKARDAKKTGGQDNFVFIIDEINRGEISKIFGELFFSIDPGYRGERGSVSTQYANLHETDDKFYIPENVYIIGTMNDIDRSVDTFDFAMRRRFRFVEVTAESQVAMLDKELGIHAEEAKLRLRNLNAAIENVQGLNSHYHIGPSYFLKLKDVDFDYELLWSDYLKPLLEDYLRGSYEEAETLDTLKKAFDLTNNDQTDQQDTGDNDADN